MDKIAPGLEALAVPIDDITPHPRNVHSGDIPTIADSLDAHGQYKPVIVQRSTGFVCAGNHTWKAARNVLQWDRIAALHLEVDDDQALRILVMDNRSAAKGADDPHALADLLRELGDLAGTGYSPDELTALLASLEAAEQAPEPGEEPGEDLQQAWGVVIACGTRDEQLALLARLGDEGLNVRALTD